MHINALRAVSYVLWPRIHSKFDHYLDTMEIMVSRNYTQILTFPLGVHHILHHLSPPNTHTYPENIHKCKCLRRLDQVLVPPSQKSLHWRDYLLHLFLLMHRILTMVGWVYLKWSKVREIPRISKLLKSSHVFGYLFFDFVFLKNTIGTYQFPQCLCCVSHMHMLCKGLWVFFPH